ncbi:MAG: hypothetical protein MJ072_06230, partial [Clostridia bacterium]|nr:hypothetical protein [Clostridia bacterium]
MGFSVDAREKDCVVISAGDYTDNSWQGTPTLKGVLHPAWGKQEAMVALETEQGERAFKFTFLKGESRVGDHAVMFKTPIKGED